MNSFELIPPPPSIMEVGGDWHKSIKRIAASPDGRVFLEGIIARREQVKELMITPSANLELWNHLRSEAVFLTWLISQTQRDN